MPNPAIRVPQIKSEIAVAIAFIGWPLRQLADYASLIGEPIGENFLEDALAEPWPEFRKKSDPTRVENLIRVLNGLGVGLQDGVFGVVVRNFTRIPAPIHLSPVAGVMTLVANYPEAQLSLAIQEVAPGDTAPAAALLINPGNRYFLFDYPYCDPAELINLLYANCLGRLSVAITRVPSVAAMSYEDAIPAFRQNDFRSALAISKSRVTDLLQVEVNHGT